MNIEVLKALASDCRLQIVCMLLEKDMSAGEIAEHFEMAQASVSRHLQVLKNAGVVSVTRDCTRMIYSLERECMSKLVTDLKETLAQ